MVIFQNRNWQTKIKVCAQPNLKHLRVTLKSLYFFIKIENFMKLKSLSKPLWCHLILKHSLPLKSQSQSKAWTEGNTGTLGDKHGASGGLFTAWHGWRLQLATKFCHLDYRVSECEVDVVPVAISATPSAQSLQTSSQHSDYYFISFFFCSSVPWDMSWAQLLCPNCSAFFTELSAPKLEQHLEGSCQGKRWYQTYSLKAARAFFL